MAAYALPYFQHLKETEHIKRLFNRMLSNGYFNDLIEQSTNNPFKPMYKFLYRDGITSKIKTVNYGNENYKFHISFWTNNFYFNINKEHKKITELYLDSPIKTNDFKTFKKHLYFNANQPIDQIHVSIHYPEDVEIFNEHRLSCLGYFKDIPQELKVKVFKTTGYQECFDSLENLHCVFFYFNPIKVVYFPHTGNWYSSKPIVKYDDQYLNLEYIVKESNDV